MSIYLNTADNNDSDLPGEVKYLRKLLNVYVNDYCQIPEIIKKYNTHPLLPGFAKKYGFTEALPVSERGLKGINLGAVKHYEFCEVEEFTGKLNLKHMISKNFTGRLFQAKIPVGFEKHNVALKTWDFNFPIRHFHFDYPTNIMTEILLLNKGEINPELNLIHPMETILRSHNILPKVIGYSIDNILAVVYDFDPKQSLQDAIPQDTLSWKDRMRGAKELACVVKLIHEKGYSIGSISSNNIMIDEKSNFKLCALVGTFLCVPTNDPVIRIPDRSYFCGTYAMLAPESVSEESVSYIKMDNFAFGVLMLELITKKVCTGNEFVDSRLREGEIRIDTSFMVEDNVVNNITQLVMSCIDRNPDNRPEMNYIVSVLEEAYFRSFQHSSL